MTNLRDGRFIVIAGIIVLTLFTVSLFSYSYNAFAEVSFWPTDPLVNVALTNAPGDQQNVVSVSDTSGGAISVWQDYRNGDTHDGDIYAQRVDSTGAVVWQSGGVPVAVVAGDQRNPEVVSDGVGGAIIVWWDYRNNSTWADLYMQRIDSNGTPLWTPNGIPLIVASWAQAYQQVISDGEGGAFVAWEHKTHYIWGTWDVYIQHVDGNGNKLWGASGVPVATGAYDQYAPRLVNDGNGGIVVAWSDKNPTTGGLLAQRLDHSGSLLWGAFGIRVSQYEVINFPLLVHDQSGGSIVAWEDLRNNNGDVFVQRITINGDMLWEQNGAQVSASNKNDSLFGIASDGSDGVIVSWWFLAGVDNFDIYSQRVSSAGDIVWSLGGVPIVSYDGLQGTHEIVSDGAGGAIAVWEDRRSGTHYDIYANRILPDGTLDWIISGVPVSIAFSDKRDPVLVPSDDGVIVVWNDQRDDPPGSGKDIFAQRVNADGSLGPRPTTPTLTPTPTERLGWEFPIDYEGRGKTTTENEFKTAFWERTSAFFDHNIKKKSFMSYVGNLYTKNIHPSSDDPDECKPVDHCYDGHRGHDFTRWSNHPEDRSEDSVYSVDDGEVVYVSDHQADGSCSSDSGTSGYGCVVIVEYYPDFGDGFVYAMYAHLSSIAIENDDVVSTDTQIGTMGNTGCSSRGCAKHLHMGVFQSLETTAEGTMKVTKQSAKVVMNKQKWEKFLGLLPPIDEYATEENMNKYKNKLLAEGIGGSDSDTDSGLGCNVTIDETKYTFIDSLGWKGDGDDPWSKLDKATAIAEKSNNSDGTKNDNNKDGEKDTTKYGCNIDSPYLWKYDVGTSSS